MATNRNRQDTEALRAQAHVTGRVEWRYSDHWGDRAKLRAGVNFIEYEIGLLCIAYDPVTGVAVEVQPIGVAVAPPRADYEVEARKALAEWNAKKREALVLTSRLVAARQERERIEEIEARYAEGGLSAVTLDEAKAVALYRRGSEFVEQTEQQARERVAVQTPTEENPS